ncbi:TPA: hypothetical protein ACLAPX_000759, partial [Neisseria meningitidis]
GYLGKIRRYLGRKQPKTCVWVSAVGRERNFAKVSVWEAAASRGIGTAGDAPMPSGVKAGQSAVWKKAMESVGRRS